MLKFKLPFSPDDFPEWLRLSNVNTTISAKEFRILLGLKSTAFETRLCANLIPKPDLTQTLTREPKPRRYWKASTVRAFLITLQEQHNSNNKEKLGEHK